MPTTTTERSQRLANLVTALTAIAEAALRGAEESATCADALDVIAAIESAARTAILEHHGIGEPVWEPSPADVAELVAANAVPVPDYSDVPF